MRPEPFKSERHHALSVTHPGKPKRIAPAPIRTKPTLWTRIRRFFGLPD